MNYFNQQNDDLQYFNSKYNLGNKIGTGKNGTTVYCDITNKNLAIKIVRHKSLRELMAN